MRQNKKDTLILVGAIAGMTGVVVRDIFNLVVVQMGFGKSYIWNMASDIFNHGPEVFTPLGHVVGILADLVIGSLVGIVLGLVIYWAGSRFYLLKGLGVGLTAWLFFFGVLQHNLPQTVPTAPKDALTNLASFFGHCIFGLVTAWTYVKLAGTIETAKEGKPKEEITLARWFRANKMRRRRPGPVFKTFKPKD